MNLAASAAVWALAGGLGSAAAQQQVGETVEGDDIVVTAAGYEQLVTQAPASISVLPREQIEENRAVSLAEVLTQVEGVDVGGEVDKSGGLSINIRGMGSDYTLVLIDGRRQNSPGDITQNNFGATATSFLPPVSAIERIEVVRGPVSTLYGSDAMGGVVNIITRAVGDHWGGAVSTNATLQGDNDFGNLYGGNFYLNGPVVSDLIGVALRGSYSEREESTLRYTRVDGSEAPITGFNGRTPTANEIWSFGARVNFTLHPDHDLWFDYDTANQWYDNSRSQMGTATATGGYGRSMEFNREQFVLAHNWRLGFGELQTTLSQGNTETLGRIVPVGPPNAGQPRTMESTNSVFDTKLFSSIANHTFTLGGQYWDAEMIDGVAAAPFEHQQWAVFLEDEWRFTDWLALTVGARYDNHSTFGDHLSPRAYLVWNVNDQFTLKGGVSQGFKTPRLEQLTDGIYGFGGQGTIPLIGTPTLQPETSTSAEIALLYDNGANVRAALTLFTNQFEDKISAGDPVANCTYGVSEADYLAGNYSTAGCVDVGYWPLRVTFGQSVNIDEAETHGAEFSLSYDFLEDWQISSTYTYTSSEQKSGANAGAPLTNTPEHALNVNLRWNVTDDVNLWLRGQYQSERYRSTAAERNAVGNYAEYTVFHLGGSYDIAENVRIGATIYNLLDEDFVSYLPYGNPANPSYAAEYAINQEPRRLWISLGVEF
ncbi:MAG: TonB-dependent receptor [Caulobacterales bacterium]|nr:TonB-dependent receptor [Caulobacterales bacterium]